MVAATALGLTAATLVMLLVTYATPSHGQGAPARPAAPAARVGDDVITLHELEESAGAQLARLEEQRHAILEERLHELIGERLLAQEAKRRGTSVEELLTSEVEAKAPEVTDADVTKFMSDNRGRLPRGDEAELKLRVREYLRAQKTAEERGALVQRLRAQSQVAVLLPVPPSLRQPVSADRGFVRGTAAAPVTIVEFSDFQCPFCKRATETVKQVLDRYPGKVKWVFRDFPIERLHPDAPRAHEAARCAGAQGKFWEYHDVLFERSPRQARADLEQYAADLKLDAPVFARCLDSRAYQQAVSADMDEGTRLGVDGTPTFFVNGRRLVGAQSLAVFERVVDAELARAAAAK